MPWALSFHREQLTRGVFVPSEAGVYVAMVLYPDALQDNKYPSKERKSNQRLSSGDGSACMPLLVLSHVSGMHCFFLGLVLRQKEECWTRIQKM